MEQIESLTFRNLEPVLQCLAGIENPWQGILDGLENPPINSTACLTVKVIVLFME